MLLIAFTCHSMDGIHERFIGNANHIEQATPVTNTSFTPMVSHPYAGGYIVIPHQNDRSQAVLTAEKLPVIHNCIAHAFIFLSDQVFQTWSSQESSGKKHTRCLTTFTLSGISMVLDT